MVSTIPATTVVYPPVNIYSAKIGEFCKIGFCSEIGKAVIGDRCSIGAFAFIPEGITLEEGVFVGPRVTFINDKYPPSGRKHWKPTLVKKFAAIGAGAVILPGVVIGVSAVVGAGAIVTSDIPDHAIVFNNTHAIRKGSKK